MSVLTTAMIRNANQVKITAMQDSKHLK